MRSRGRQVRQGSLGSLGCAQGSLGSLGCAQGSLGSSVVVGFNGGAPWRSPGPSRVDGFIVVRPWGIRVNQVSLGSLGCALCVVGFIRDHLSAHRGSSSSSVVTGFIDVRPGGRRYHL